MTGDLANESFSSEDDMMKSLFKKIYQPLMMAMSDSPESMLKQYEMMRDCLNEMIDELKNGDVINTK